MPDPHAQMVRLEILSAPLEAYIRQIVTFAGLPMAEEGEEAGVLITDVQSYTPANGQGKVFVAGPAEVLEQVDGTAILLPFPLRAGVLLNMMRQAIAHQMPEFPGEVRIGPYVFFPAAMALHKDGQDVPIKLTEKERDLLYFLYVREGQTISRAEILQTLWGYVDGVETHTLETHFYRLRQKIEDDPSKPKLLVTSEDGYNLKI